MYSSLVGKGSLQRLNHLIGWKMYLDKKDPLIDGTVLKDTACEYKVSPSGGTRKKGSLYPIFRH